MSYFLDQFRDNFSNFEWKFAVLILLIRSLFLRPEYEFCVDRFSSFMQAFKRLNGLKSDFRSKPLRQVKISYELNC